MTITALRPPVLLPSSPRRHHTFGFWVAATALLVNMGFSAVPTPLYILYQRRDHFSTITVTLVYSAYAAGVIGCLFLGGHVSDWVGRKRVFVPALLANVVAAAIFVMAPSLPGLLTARVVSGVSVGLTTATATAYLSELHQRRSAAARGAHRGQVVATVTNLGGIGIGPLVAGLLAQFAPQPLRVPYYVFGVVLLILAVLVAISPETVTRPEHIPAWRPQRVAVPPEARRMFLAATAAGVGAFAVYGVFNSLAPAFLAGTLHETSHAIAGLVAFSAFAAGALAQIVAIRVPVRDTLRLGAAVLIPGLALLVAGMWLPSLPVFVLGGAVAGAGAGLVFRGAVATATSTAPPLAGAEVLAGFFLGAYLGLSVPVIGLGIATQLVAPRVAMLAFVVLVSFAVISSVRAVLHHTDSLPKRTLAHHRSVRQRLIADPVHGPLPAMLVGLTALTGIVDAVSILALGRVFVANMTGNVVFAGFALAGAPGFALTASLAALAGFIAGAGAGGSLIRRMGQDRARLLAVGSALQLILVIAALALTAASGSDLSAASRDIIAAVLAVGTGMQNAVVRRLAVPDMTTTVLTLTLTGIAADIRAGKPSEAFKTRVLAVATMLAGAVAGAELVLHHGPSAALALAAALLAVVTAAAAHATRTPAEWRSPTQRGSQP